MPTTDTYTDKIVDHIQMVKIRRKFQPKVFSLPFEKYFLFDK